MPIVRDISSVFIMTLYTNGKVYDKTGLIYKELSLASLAISGYKRHWASTGHEYNC